jgi:uncharacterized membrane protein
VTTGLASVWLHLLGVVVWIGGLMYQAHVLMPATRRNGGAPLADMLRRGRRVTWVAIALVVVTGFYNVTLLGPLDRALQSGAALLLALKFMLVLAAVAVAGQRDFAQVPRLARAVAAGDDPGPALSAITWMDRVVLLLAVVIVYLGLAVSRA